MESKSRGVLDRPIKSGDDNYLWGNDGKNRQNR
jgi:hypothetical protein